MKDQSFARNTMALTLGSIATKGLQFLVVPLFSRWLPTEEYGQFDLLYTYISLLIPIISLSTHEAVFRFCVDETDERVKRGNISTALAINVVNLLIVLPMMALLWRDMRPFTFFCFTLYLIAEAFGVYLRGYLRAAKKLNVYSFSMAISTVCSAIMVTVFVYFMHMGLDGILLGYALGTCMGDMLLCVWGRWFSTFSARSVSSGRARKLIAYSLPLVPNDVSWWVMNASDRQIINIFFGNAANGIYAIAHKIPALCSVIFTMFSISWQQEIVEKIGDPSIARYANSVLNKLVVMLFTICSGLMAGSFILYDYVFDSRYREAMLYSPILILAAALMAVSQFFGGIQIALKRPRQNGITTVIGAVCNLLIHLSLVRHIGLYAAAVSTLAANGIIVGLRLLLLRKAFRFKLNGKALAALGMLTYFMVCIYLQPGMALRVLNLLVAAAMFVGFNYALLQGLGKASGGGAG